VGFFPSEGHHPARGALLFEQNDETAEPRARYSTLEIITQLSDDPSVKSPDVAA